MDCSHKGSSATHRILLLLTLWVAGCQVAEIEVVSVSDLIQSGQFEAAVRQASEEYALDPGDPVVQAWRLNASVAWLLDQGRTELLDDQDDTAMQFFQKAVALDSSNQVAVTWLWKVRRKIADRLVSEGEELEASDDLSGAIQRYGLALELVTDDGQALAGLERATLLTAWRIGVAEKYYGAGVRDMRAFQLFEARSNFDYSDKYRPGDERSARRREEVEHFLVQRRLAIAADLERQGLYAAASTEFRMTLLVDPENTIALQGRERTSREIEAQRILSEAEMLALRGNLAAAMERVGEGNAITRKQGDSFAKLARSIEEDGFRRVYQRAKALEQDLLFREAILVYNELLDVAEFFEDAISRRNTLQEFVQEADRTREQALREGTPSAAASALRRIEIVWPEYDRRDDLVRLSGDAADGDQ